MYVCPLLQNLLLRFVILFRSRLWSLINFCIEIYFLFDFSIYSHSWGHFYIFLWFFPFFWFWLLRTQFILANPCYNFWLKGLLDDLFMATKSREKSFICICLLMPQKQNLQTKHHATISILTLCGIEYW